MPFAVQRDDFFVVSAVCFMLVSHFLNGKPCFVFVQSINSNMNSFNICKVRDVYRAVLSLEHYFEENYNLNLNEAMLLCTLFENNKLTAGDLAERLGLTCSNTSKVIASAEKKKLIKRSMGKEDKRKMLFSLTPQGTDRLSTLKADPVELPEPLR